MVTAPASFSQALSLLTGFEWGVSSTERVLIFGERKTCRVSVLLLTEADDPTASMTSALEQLAPMINPGVARPVLAHQAFDVEFIDVPRSQWSDPLAVRLTRLTTVPAGVTTLAAIGRHAVDRLRASSPGFVGAIGLTHAGSGKAIFIELFTTRTALRDSEVTAYLDAREAREAGILTEPPEHEIYQLYPLQHSANR